MSHSQLQMVREHLYALLVVIRYKDWCTTQLTKCYKTEIAHVF